MRKKDILIEKKIDMKLENTLKRRWKHMCDEYLDLFCQKHGLDYSDSYWIGDKVGTIVFVCDYFIDLYDIRYDIDNNIEESMFDEWYWKNLRATEVGLNSVSYSSFCEGAPLHSDFEIERLSELQKKVDESKKILEDAIKEINSKKE